MTRSAHNERHVDDGFLTVRIESPIILDLRSGRGVKGTIRIHSSARVREFCFCIIEDNARAREQLVVYFEEKKKKINLKVCLFSAE